MPWLGHGHGHIYRGLSPDLQIRDEELHRGRGPDSAAQPLRHLHEAGAVALDGADCDHDDVGVGEELGGVGDAIVHLLCSATAKHQQCNNININ